MADTFLLALSNSVIFTTGKQVVDPAIITSRTAWNRAALAGLIEFVEEAVLTSWLYRWLTAEPEPEIIVIDLRETVSVGPLIVLIDRAIGILVPAHQRAAAVRFVGRFYESFLNAPVRVAGFVLFTAVLANLAITFAVGYPTRGWLFVSIFLLTVAGLGTRITITWEELVETRPVRLLISALEPPAITDDEERRR